jgi:hypothetical protein
VVWYAQRLTRALGTDLLKLSLQDFGFGNADMSGEKGSKDGLEGAWLSSPAQLSLRLRARCCLVRWLGKKGRKHFGFCSPEIGKRTARQITRPCHPRWI